jgi:hypothetical protein
LLPHFLRIAGLTAGIVLGALLPFLPGEYARLAAPLSMVCRVVGMAGLLLVPIGAVWVASGHWSLPAGTQRGIALAALIVSSIT